jgi:hypothetical protein
VVYDSDLAKAAKHQSELRKQLNELHRVQSEAFAKEERIRKQLLFWQRREAEMIRRDLKSLDELDRIEAEERAAAEALQPSLATPVPSSSEYSDLLAGWDAAGLDLLGGIPSPPVDTSQGS